MTLSVTMTLTVTLAVSVTDIGTDSDTDNDTDSVCLTVSELCLRDMAVANTVECRVGGILRQSL